MIRLVVVAAGAFALSQTPAVKSVGDDIRDFRERQYLVGKRLGCELQLAQAAVDGDTDGVVRLTDQCADLRREHERL
jgi:hypothetical protein